MSSMDCFKVRWLPVRTPEISSGEVAASQIALGAARQGKAWRRSRDLLLAGVGIQMLMLTMYPKNERTDLTAAQVKQLTKIVEDLK
jgi:hypothetical protein